MSEKEDTYSFNVAEFIGDHANLFLTMGVFAGIATYISNLSGTDTGIESLARQAGIVTSLFLSVFMFYIIYKMMAKKAGGVSNLLVAHTIDINPDLFVFTIANFVLGSSLLLLLLQFDQIAFTLIFVSVLLVVLYIYRLISKLAAVKVDFHHTRGVLFANLLIFHTIISLLPLLYLFENVEMIAINEFNGGNIEHIVITSVYAFFTCNFVSVLSMAVASSAVITINAMRGEMDLSWS